MPGTTLRDLEATRARTGTGQCATTRRRRRRRQNLPIPAALCRGGGIISGRLRAQFETLDLAARSPWKIGAEFDPTGILEGSKLPSAVVAQDMSQCFARPDGRLKHDNRLWFNQTVFVGLRDHRR